MICTKLSRTRKSRRSKKRAKRSLLGLQRSNMSFSTTDSSRSSNLVVKFLGNTDKGDSPLDDDGSSDIAAYNKELEQRGHPKWHDVAWLYAECYLYRYVQVSLRCFARA